MGSCLIKIYFVCFVKSDGEDKRFLKDGIVSFNLLEVVDSWIRDLVVKVVE